METILSIVQKINFYLSDYILTFLLVGTGLFFTIKTRFVQVRCFPEAVKKFFSTFSLNSDKSAGKISAFSALATAIAGQVGTGNIVGAAGAILTGGPGAIFWMWIIAFFGMATNYAEAVLAQETKTVDSNGTVLGGPVYYIKKAFPNLFGKVLALFFSISAILALGFMGAMVQSNSLSIALEAAFGVKSQIVGALVCIVSAMIFLGGVKAIASVSEKIVPVMAVLYITGSLIVLILNIKNIPETFGMIFKYAFSPQAIIGGSAGYALKTAITQGVKRGLFSNEAGMGSTPHAHALADVKAPHEQGIMAMMGVFIDTFIVLTLTALVTINTLYADGGILSTGSADGIDKNNMVQTAFSQFFGKSAGQGFVAISLFFFAFSTIIGWNYFGRSNVQYLFKSKKAVAVYSIISVVFIFLGSCLSNDLVWELTDMFNQFMVIPNVIALFALSPIVAKESKRTL